MSSRIRLLLSEILDELSSLVYYNAMCYTELNHKPRICALDFFFWHSVESDSNFLSAGVDDREAKRKKHQYKFHVCD